jgi:hypothetical protein
MRWRASSNISGSTSSGRLRHNSDVINTSSTLVDDSNVQVDDMTFLPNDIDLALLTARREILPTLEDCFLILAT